MRGVASASDKLVPPAAALTEAEDILGRDEFSEVDAEALVAYLARGETPWQPDLQAAMQEAGIHLRSLRPLTDYIARRWIQQVSGDYTPCTAPLLTLRCNLADPGTMWIHCGSCFVAVVDKMKAGAEKDEGAYVWNRLGAALRAWRPNFYRLVLSEIQNALELEAVTDHEAWLDDNLCLGLGLYLLESQEAAAGKVHAGAIAGSAQSLIDRFVDLIRRRLATHIKITDTATTVLSARLSTKLGEPLAGENARHARARELASIAPGAPCDWRNKVLPSVNAFMVSDEFRGGHITTGSVLRSGESSYWLCVSPACDLEPREEGPLLVQLVLLTKSETDKYTTGEHVVAQTGEGPLVLKALNPLNRQPSLRVLLLPNGTEVVRNGTAPPMLSGWFAANLTPSEAVSDASAPAAAVASKGGGGGPETPMEANLQPVAAALTATEFSVIAQLRGTFATRFLLTAGQHLSRVGVDFIDQ